MFEKNPIVEYAASLDAPPAPVRGERALTWEPPNLGPTQKKIYWDDSSKYLLCTGERGSGKSWIAAQKAVRYCYENFNALAIIIVGVKRQAMEGGIWFRLETDILPMWKAATGMEYTETKTNVVKDVFCMVSNRYGGWSRILLLSMPVDSFIGDRVKGMEPSFVLIDEAQTLASDQYFSKIVQQLGRRQMIQGNQQYIATCNPDGPSHWLYRRFWELPLNKETGEYNKDYAVFHVSISENIQNLPDGYYERVIEAVKDDPVEYRRMVLGEWIDRPTGDSIFKNYYSPALHVKGNTLDGTRILPKVGSDIILGFDLGTANSAVVFMQNLVTSDKEVYTVFDEATYLDAYIPYTLLVPSLMRRINFWNETCKTKFNVVCISDSSAFNQYRATDGTYDNYEIERLSREALKDFPDLQPLKVLPAPRFNGSVAARVKTTMKYLQQERLIISDSCTKVKDMFMKLEMEKAKPGKYLPELPFQPARSKHLHSFDALSYVLLFFEMGNTPWNLRDVAPPELVSLGTVR